MIGNFRTKEIIMKNAKFFFSLLLCYSGLVLVAAEPQEAPLEMILMQSTIRERLLPNLF